MEQQLEDASMYYVHSTTEVRMSRLPRCSDSEQFISREELAAILRCFYRGTQRRNFLTRMVIDDYSRRGRADGSAHPVADAPGDGVEFLTMITSREEVGMHPMFWRVVFLRRRNTTKSTMVG